MSKFLISICAATSILLASLWTLRPESAHAEIYTPGVNGQVRVEIAKEPGETAAGIACRRTLSFSPAVNDRVWVEVHYRSAPNDLLTGQRGRDSSTPTSPDEDCGRRFQR